MLQLVGRILYAMDPQEKCNASKTRRDNFETHPVGHSVRTKRLNTAQEPFNPAASDPQGLDHPKLRKS